MIISVLATALFVVIFLAELTFLRRSGLNTPARDQDHSSLRYILLSYLAVPLGVAVALSGVGRIGRGDLPLRVGGFALLLLGWLIRRQAINTLREYHTIDVAVGSEHQLIRRGLYRTIRHPSYTGYLFRFLGLGLAWANWITLLLIFTPQLLAILYRIRVEERALAASFGPEYDDYRRTTKKLLPKIY
jgi:protein-S-isoprenylcysteine O-methyltransferase Ste14